MPYQSYLMLLILLLKAPTLFAQIQASVWKDNYFWILCGLILLLLVVCYVLFQQIKNVKKNYESILRKKEDYTKKLNSQLDSQNQDLLILNKAFEARKECIELRKSISEKRLTNLVGLSKSPEIQTGDWEKTSNLITKTVIENLRISHCSLWYYNHREKKIYCTSEANQNKKNNYFGFMRNVSQTEVPLFFRAMNAENIIAYDDLEIENDTLFDSLTEKGFVSVLFLPIQLSMKQKGFIFCANLKQIYTWEIEDFIFLKSIKDLVLLAFESSRRGKVQRQLEQQTAEIKKNNDKLLQLNHVKDKLFSIVAHDIRAPLGNITGLLKLLQEKDISYNDFLDILPEINHNLYYTNDLIENLLYWAKDQMEGTNIHPQIFDITELIEDNVALLRSPAQQKEIDLQIKYPKDTPEKGIFIEADKEMIKLVIRNLLTNAIKFTFKNKNIYIYWRLFTSRIIITVEDEGMGMPQDLLPKLFAGDNYTSRGTNNEKGTGLGLRICKEFVEKNNGSIMVESELNEGSKFHVTLPINQKRK